MSQRIHLKFMVSIMTRSHSKCCFSTKETRILSSYSGCWDGRCWKNNTVPFNFRRRRSDAAVCSKDSDNHVGGVEIDERLLEHLGVEENIIKFISENHELPGLLYALHLQLKGKRYLILLDDVRDKGGYYEELISCLRDGHGFPKWNGAAIIVTSRHEKAIKTMVGEQNLHRLLPLSDPESCWQIYWNIVSDDEAESSTPKEVKDELKKKCGGLPLAARIMGELKHREMNKKASNYQPPIESEKPKLELAPTSSKDGSSQSQPLGPIDAPTVSGDGSKEPTASKDGSKSQAPTAPHDDLNEAASEDGSKSQAPTASHDDLNDAASEDGPNQTSM